MAIHEAKHDNKWSGTTTTRLHHGNHCGGHRGSHLRILILPLDQEKVQPLVNVKKNPKESLRDYVKRFKAEKVKIIGCDDSITSTAFQKRLPANHPLFGEMIMKEDLTLADSFALAEKHALWDKARRVDKAPKQPKKESAMAQKKKDMKQSSKNRQKNESWFKLSKQSKEDTSKLDHTKYYAFHRGLGHTIDNYYTWKNYLEKLVKEGKADRYLDKRAVQPRRNANDDEEPSTKTIQINGIIESEHLGATNYSKKMKIQQVY
ncbi:uncharacterized protein [Pyrus communis]|uniref:uncharacterized protein n=1 Tax=Pyrus communis TaxID=23211 RepID=UPI0035C12E29